MSNLLSRIVTLLRPEMPEAPRKRTTFFLLPLFALLCSTPLLAQAPSPPLDTAVRYVGHYLRAADSVEVYRLMTEAANQPDARRDSALVLTQQAANLAEASVENGLHLDVAETWHWVGRHALNRGKPELAEQAFRHELELRDKLAGPDDPARANCIDHLGRSIRSGGRPSEALPYYRQALALRKRYYAGVDHPDLAGGMNNLALVESNLGHFVAADSLYNESIVMKKRIYTTDDLDMATTLNNLGLAELELGKIDAGTGHLEEGVAMLNRTGTAKPILAAGMTGLARAYYAQGRYDTALTLARQAQEFRTVLFRGDHPALASSNATIGRLLWKTGNKAEGERLLREAISMSERLHPNGHAFTASAMEELGSLMREDKRYAEAKTLLSDALALRRKVLEADHPHTAAALIELARAEVGTADEEEMKNAETLLKEADGILEKNFPGAHPMKVDLHQAKGELANGRSRTRIAVDEYKTAAAMMKEMFPAGHPERSELLRELADLLEANGDTTGANTARREADASK